jgi:glycogen operon protein
MLLAGDELARTQLGNNNAFCQDNEISWVDWSLNESDSEFTEFVRQLIALRKNISLLRRDRFVHGKEHSPSTGFADIEWRDPSGQPMQEPDWHHPDNSCVGMLLSDVRGIDAGNVALVMLIIFNAAEKSLEFQLPKNRSDLAWRCVLCTASDDQTGTVIDPLVVEARSVYMLQA